MTFDPSLPPRAEDMPEGGAVSSDMSYVPFSLTAKPIIPIDRGLIGGFRGETEPGYHRDWPYRIVALTVWTEPMHPELARIVVHPVIGPGDLGNFTPEQAQTHITQVDTASGIPPDVVVPISGDLYGLIGPEYHA